jgi:hypothetical protein
MSQAVRRLARNSVIALSREEATDFLGSSPPEARSYLARASAYAPRDASAATLADAAAVATFDVEWYPDQQTILITTLQPPTEYVTLAQNVAVVLSTDAPVRHVVVACYSIR